MFKITLGDSSPEVLKLLANTPVSSPPYGVTPNFVDPPTRRALQMWTTSVFGIVALVFYSNRVYIKVRMMKSWTWDELTLFITVLMSIAQYSVAAYAVTRGVLGRHLWDISISQALDPAVPHISYAILVLAPLTLMFLKATFFVLYIHLFSRIRWIMILSWTGLVYSVLSHAGIAIYAFAVANPRENHSWADRALDLGVPTGAVGLVSDVMILVIPIAAIIPLKLSIAKKIGASAIFLTGGSAIICAIMNIYYRHKLRESTDSLWDTIPCSIFSTCEVFIGITCACIPTVAYGFKQEGSIYQRVFLGRKSVMTRMKRPADSMSIESNIKMRSMDTTEEPVRSSVLSDMLVDGYEEATELKSMKPTYLCEPRTRGTQFGGHIEQV